MYSIEENIFEDEYLSYAEAMDAKERFEEAREWVEVLLASYPFPDQKDKFENALEELSGIFNIKW